MRLSIALVLSIVIFQSTIGIAQDKAAEQPKSLELFNQRILPIFNSPNPSSCVQCHLSAIDIKNYILPSEEKTFVSLRDQGLIDLKNPKRSKILTLIAMGDKDEDDKAKRIHASTRKAEFAAFSAWIQASCKDPRLLRLPKMSQTDLAKPERDPSIIRHARKNRVIDSFVRNIWSQRMRCFPCHTPHDIDPSNPKHKLAGQRQKEFRQKYGERMDIFRKTPEKSMDYLVQASRKASGESYPLLNLQQPTKSLLLLKPMSKLPKRNADKQFGAPSSTDPVSHMGGLKLHRNDQSYKSFLAWIGDYAKVTKNQYTRVKDLPADNWHPTKLVIKLARTPESWKVGVPVQIFVHGRDPNSGKWESQPLAFTQGTVTPRKRVNGALFLLSSPATTSSNASEKLKTPEKGRYLLKAYVDRRHILAHEPVAMLTEKDFVGQTVVEIERWQEGFKFGLVVQGARFQGNQDRKD